MTGDPHRATEQGATIIELLVATALGLAAAGLCGQALTTHQAPYRSAVSALDRAVQARFAMALLSAELGAVVTAPRATGCPGFGPVVSDGRVEFVANLYDRDTALTHAVPAGAVVADVESAGSFEVNDTVLLVDVGEASDPSDDASQCVRLTAIVADRFTFDPALERRFPAGSPATLVNRVRYRLDNRGRLMRTQDGGTQRVADQVAAFHVGIAPRVASIGLTMQGGATHTRRVLLGEIE